MAGSPPGTEPARHSRWFTRVLFRAPTPAASVVLLVVLSLAATVFIEDPLADPRRYLSAAFLLFLLPGVVGAFLTPTLARALGGRLTLKRSALLALTALVVAVPLLVIWRLVTGLIPAAQEITATGILLLVLGPGLWFREMSLFGLSRPSHARSVAPALLQPALGAIGIATLFPITPAQIVGGVLILLVAFASCALLLRAADRPIRREFGVSGVSLIRPLLDHINLRDPEAEATLEAFFARFARPATLAVTLVAFRSGGRTKATLALPTVHPGPFAALGASDLPRKLEARLGASAGLVLVPHTPCNHDLDLPTTVEVDRVAASAIDLMGHLDGPQPARASRLIAAGPTPLVRAQLLGGTALVVVSQAPAPTDDIDYAVAEQVRRAVSGPEAPRLALIDGHNSYVEDQGDITFGTATSERVVREAAEVVEQARAAAAPGAVHVGVAARGGYSIGEHGIGPAGIRCLAVRAGGSVTVYVLIDGNNLVRGHREVLLRALEDLADDAEILTTDNHVVHEVDGSINPVGERFPADALARDVRAIAQSAVADLTEVDVYSGTTAIPEVPVLGPDWTARLLTSLGDTVSMFANAGLMTFLLLLTTSLLILAAVD